MSPRSLPYITLLAAFFGTTLVVSRFSVSQYAPVTYIALRLAIASLCFFLIIAVSGRYRFPRDPLVWRHAPLFGIFSAALPMTLIVSSLQYQSSGVTSLLLTIGPAVTVIMAHFWLHDERLTPRKLSGLALAIAGAALLVVLGESGLPEVNRANPLGYALVIAAILLGSAMTVYARKYMRHLPAFDVSSLRIWTAALVMIPLSFLIAGFDMSNVNAQGYAALLYAALIGTFGGLFMNFYTVKRFGATAAAMTSNLIPIVAITVGVIFLGETVTMGMGAGMVLILGGMALLTRADAAISDRQPLA